MVLFLLGQSNSILVILRRWLTALETTVGGAHRYGESCKREAVGTGEVLLPLMEVDLGLCE